MKKPTRIALTCVVAVQLAGCASVDGSPSQTTQGVAAGALLGGIIGAVAGGNSQGALVGALAGAAIGGIVGNYQDRQTASRAEAAKRYALESQPRLELESSTNLPGRAMPGAAVESQVGYTVLAPGSPQDVKVTESRTLVRGSESYALSKREVTRSQGTFVSTLKFTLPKDLPAGNYSLVTTVNSLGLTRTVEAPLSVGA